MYLRKAWAAVRKRLQEPARPTQDGRTLRRCLHEMGYWWNRPRFVQRHLDPHWRQAQGGSKRI
jgi:hypothetical protein